MDRQHTINGDARPCFFPGLTLRALSYRLAHFHIARRDRPKSGAWLNGATTEQHAVAYSDDTANNDLRILVGHEVAIGANEPFPIVTFGDASYQAGHA